MPKLAEEHKGAYLNYIDRIFEIFDHPLPPCWQALTFGGPSPPSLRWQESLSKMHLVYKNYFEDFFKKQN